MPGGGRELLGKPPVYCRKTVNAIAPDGTKVSSSTALRIYYIAAGMVATSWESRLWLKM